MTGTGDPTDRRSLPRLIICVGLQRSGNHAVSNWISALFSGTVFLNDQDHRVFHDAAALRAKLGPTPKPVTILSFEDSEAKSRAPLRPLLESLGQFPKSELSEYHIQKVLVLRDPYNTWASRATANANRARAGRPSLTSDPSWALYRENWRQLAGLVPDPEWLTILYNRWLSEGGYRRALCNSLGGTYSEATLGVVSVQGGGSSFDGVPRPSYLGMLRRLPYYASSHFLRRLANQPAHYLRRFLTPQMTARDLQTETRWQSLPADTDIFADVELADTTRQVFGPFAPPPAQK